MPDLADHLDEALAELWSGNSAAFERLIQTGEGENDTLDEIRESSEAPSMWLTNTLRSAAASLGRPTPSDAAPIVAGFEIVGELGRGGMGVVYEAVQQHPRRTVALKLMRPGREDDAYHRMLFDREVRALASLEHPNITSLHDASTTLDGRAFIVMELVRGLPINVYAEQASLTVQSRLGLFCQLCDAVHHAHLRGVIHRDLKPSNVLVVDHSNSGSSSAAALGAGRVKVMDFGLARLIDGDGQNHSQTIDAERIKGTMAYMSPEQMRGDSRALDGRSDVYSLGVMLYQLLTGRLPLDPTGRSLPEIVRAAEQATPPRLRDFSSSLRGDLEVIAQTAMTHDQSRRYQSAAQLADDVRRYLAHEPIFARPATAIYQLRTFARRNKTLVIATCAVMAALIAGFAATAVALMQTRAAQQETRQARQSADQINEFLNQMLSSADPTVTRAYDMPLSAMLDEAVRRLEGGALAGQDPAEAQVRMTIADTYLSLGLYPEARAQYEAALKLRLQSLGPEHLAAADTMLRLAYVMVRQQQFTLAEELVNEALAIRVAKLGKDDLLVVHALRAKAEVWNGLGRQSEARALLCELVPKAVRIAGTADNDEVAQVKCRLGFLGGCSNSNDDALAVLREALATQRKLHEGDHDLTARTLVNIGSVLLSQRKFAEAEATLVEAVEMRQRLFGDDHPSTAIALYNLGTVYINSNRVPEAEAILRKALEIQQRRLVPGHYETGRSRSGLGAMLVRLNRLEEAEIMLRQAIGELSGQIMDVQAAKANAARRWLATAFVRQKRFDEAQTVMNEALEFIHTRLVDKPEELRDAATIFVRIYQAWGKTDEMELWNQRLAEYTVAVKQHQSESQ